MLDGSLPLTGLRVVDFSTLLPGPFCTMLLADFGADVIKVERPPHGDPLRGGEVAGGRADPGFSALNRNKRSIVIDLRHPDGKQVVLSLLRSADVLVEQFRPGVMARLGLDYETVSVVNPGLVYCSITGYGQTGPYTLLPGHDLNYVGLSGMLGLMESPVVPGVQVADIMGALMASVGILLALAERQRSGRGQHIDVSLLDSAIATLALTMARHLDGRPPVPGGERLTGGDPAYQVYRTADGRHVALAALEPRFWENFCRAVGREEWVPLRATGGDGLKLLRDEIADLFRSRSLAEWIDAFRGVDTCMSPVLRLEEVPGDPHVAHRGILTAGPAPGGGVQPMVGVPIRLSRTPGRLRRAAPGLGEDADAILREVGYSEEAIADLAERGIVKRGGLGKEG